MSMTAPLDTPASSAEAKKDVSSSSSKISLFRDARLKPSKKSKDVLSNGVQQDTNNGVTVAPGGSADSAVGTGDIGASTWQGPTSTNLLQPSTSTREGDGSHSGNHSVEQGTTASTGDRDTQREKASLSTTVTGTATTSKHRKDKTSETAHSATINEKSESRSRSKKDKSGKKKKKSIWSKLASAVFKCTWPTDPAHPIDIDEGVSGVSDPSSSPNVPQEPPISEKSKEAQETKDTDVPVQNGPNAEPTPLVPSTSTEVTPLTPAPDLTLPETDDVSVIVPPSPTKHVLPEDDTLNLTSGSVVPPGSTGREAGEESDESSMLDEDEEHKQEEEDEEERLIMNGGAGIPIGQDGVPRPLLPPIAPQHAGRKCLVLDLDETLVHSSFKSIQHADYVVPVEIEYHWHNVYVIKRPGVDLFLKKMGEIYEVVVFTASLSKYADPVLDKLDIHNVVTHRLFRESCYNHKGNYVKDLSQLGRPIEDTIILDNSPASYIFHPNNAVPVSSWFNDPHDTELTDLCPFLADLGTVDDVRGVLDGGL
ncbi:hypothetical protein M0805_009417 [Coniferiporia weirii]|nr:hypothetical protein M0805_009417 [Coniferiporia weirii]